MEVDDGATISSDEETINNLQENRLHSAEIKLGMESNDIANIVCRTLSVDKEPSRSNATRTITVDGNHLIINIASSDRKSMQKSIANTLEMCELAKSTIDLAQTKAWIQESPVSKKAKLSA